MDNLSPSTVGRNRNYTSNDISINISNYEKDGIHLFCGNSLDFYNTWEKPTVIISDGGYGILGFKGDTANPSELPKWYEPHIEQWSLQALPSTTLWFWNTEVGWASVHPILEQYGWEYINCNFWNKGLGHIAGNVNTQSIRRFPVVTEVCVQYAYKPKINGLSIQEWLISEWKRSKIPFNRANIACGVVNAATRKYFDKGHLWYFPPADMFEKISNYANEHGDKSGLPYFSKDGKKPISKNEWELMRYKFHCPQGFTNVWNRNALAGKERIKSPNGGIKSAHLNQKPLDLMKLIIEASSDENDCIWEPFGGMFSACLASSLLHRRAYGAEIDQSYYSLALTRFTNLNQC